MKRHAPYLNGDTLSPDPTLGRKTKPSSNGCRRLTLHPHGLIRCSDQSPAVHLWARALDLHQRPGPVTMRPDADGHLEWVVDFGTELDAELEISLATTGAANIEIWRGESVAEAEGAVFGAHPPPASHRHLPRRGRHRIAIASRGLRFVRCVLRDAHDRVTLTRMAAHAVFTFDRYSGNLQCSDRLFQRVWQASAYTARLCTRPTDIWDGVKRGRHGWFGDARITKLAADQVFFQPEPAETMLARLPTDSWANGIPNYSFDAVAMLLQHILYYGLERDCVRPVFEKVRALLDWTLKTQTTANGLIHRTDQPYFLDIGFLDWSAVPLGGRLEELSWLQCKYAGALRDAAMVADWLGETDRATVWTRQADRLSHLIVKRFWRPGVGLLHTLNHTGQAPNPHSLIDRNHYELTYRRKIRLGPSGPSRHSCALGVLCGVLPPGTWPTVRTRVFNNPRIAPVITAYFGYYEQMARATCGDPCGAVNWFRDYVGAMLEREDAATVWEAWSPAVNDLRKYSSSFEFGNAWPLSLCHGWGAGAIPVATRCLAGVEPVAPGWRRLRIAPAVELPWAWRADIPTPCGPIQAERSQPGARIHYRVPREIEVAGGPGQQWTIEKVRNS